jgi:hypothetical protein
MSELRHLIREILAEELGKMPVMQIPAPRVTEELVSIRSNADLEAFVRRLMAAAQDGRLRADIETGRHVFRLANSGASQVPAHQPTAPAPQRHSPVRFERGMVSERDVASLPKDARRIDVGKSVRFTPLARDELRRRGINVERAQS